MLLLILFSFCLKQYIIFWCFFPKLCGIFGSLYLLFLNSLLFAFKWQYTYSIIYIWQVQDLKSFLDVSIVQLIVIVSYLCVRFLKFLNCELIFSKNFMFEDALKSKLNLDFSRKYLLLVCFKQHQALQ